MKIHGVSVNVQRGGCIKYPPLSNTLHTVCTKSLFDIYEASLLRKLVRTSWTHSITQAS